MSHMTRTKAMFVSPQRLRAFIVSLCLVVLLLPAGARLSAQGSLNELLTISVNAGYDGRFRPNQWMPLRITVENNGNPIEGRLVVRPETSGSGVPNMFSTPVDLPTGSSQAIFLYIIARNNASSVRVELLNENGGVISSQDVNVRDILPRDRLYAVVTQATANIPDLTELQVGGYEAFQALWGPADVPDRSGALDALDVMLFTDVDTGNLSAPQQRAVESWVIGGGHLIVTGGAGWQLTAAGLEDLLPLVPNTSETTTDLSALAELAGDFNESLEGEVIVAMGDVTEDATVLVKNQSGTPLVIRRQLGNGTVDYVAVDPGSQPLRGWDTLDSLWFTLMTSTDARPSWSHGFSNWASAMTAVEILPGLDLLPAALALIGFLVAYIAIVGPLNYIILSRINKREYAWVTIPILIIIFSVLAWSVGFEVRGNQATLSRVSVVQTWPDTEEAHIDQLVGLLAPRRDNYTLSMTDDRLMHPYAASFNQPGTLRGQVQTSTNIEQTNRFAAVEFPVDASFIAAFSTRGTVERPEIGGRLTMSFSDDIPNLETLQGAIRNDSELVLLDPVILSRGGTLRLATPLEAGQVLTIDANDITLLGDGLSVPSRLEYAAGDDNGLFNPNTFGAMSFSPYSDSVLESAIDILGSENYLRFDFGVSLSDDSITQETRRRQAFLDSFILDQFASKSRGNRVYLAGWTQSAPTEEALANTGFDVVDTTLYIIELEVQREQTNAQVVITQDQFTWVTKQRLGMDDAGVSELTLRTDTELIYRFTPLPGAVLDEVNELIVIVERTGRSGFSDGAVELWNWEDEAWEVVEIDLSLETRNVITNPGRFIGPLNAVEMRVTRLSSGGSVYLDRVGIEQVGQF